MGKTEFIIKIILMYTITGIFIYIMLFLLASFTILPMMDNYRECESIFLCSSLQSNSEK